MKERGVILRDHEVRCVLAGAKTQLRRPCSVQPALDRGLWHVFYPWGEGGHGIYETEAAMRLEYDRLMLARSPFGAAGGRLWVKEAFNWSAAEELSPGEYRKLCPERTGWRAPYCVYRADGIKAHPEHPDWGAAIWKASTQMPRWASRITLDVTGVRVQRLHDISEEDAKAEGVQSDVDALCALSHLRGAAAVAAVPSKIRSAREAFAALWDEDNAKSAPWSSNPFVWVVEFKVREVTGRKEAA